MNNKHLLILPLLFIAFCLKAQNFTMRQVVCGMQMPWEITYGPDNFIWATEARGYKVSRTNPATGTSTVLLDLSNNKNFPNYPSVSPQGGLTGMALHPNLLSGKPYVYLSYIFRYDGGSAPTGQFFKTKVVRYTYNTGSQTLTNEEVICDTIPGSNDHNGGRMTIANVNGEPYMFYGVGDMGAGQFANANRVHKAQDPTSYEGKILRFNLEPDADVNAFEKWIPNDGLNTFGRAVWSIGHRNPQGLVAGANGNLYEAEHGPYSDDELNLISAGRNYGFPLVVGAADGNYNNAAVGEGPTVPLIVNEATNAANLGANYRNPLKSFFPWDNASVRIAYQNAVNNTPPVSNYYLSWNSIAPSGIAYYGSNAIPNWQNSILITSLKRRRVYRLQLDAAGTAVVSDTLPFFADMGRYRDLAISPDGTKIYVSCDSEGQTSGPTAGTTIDPPNKGCILEFTYTPTSLCVLTNCPQNQTVTTGSNSAVVSWAEPSLSNCANGTTLVASIPPGSTFPLGTRTVTYTATDPSNLRTTCSFNVTVTAQTGTYCASKGNAPWSEWIANVQIGTLNNASQKEGYRYFTETNQTTDLAKGRSYPLSITQGFSWAGDPATATQQGRAWIDFNRNGIFEDTEIVATFNRNTTTANIVIPTTATIGATRMRISLKTNGLPTACETFEKGEVEDYTVTITDGIIASRPDLEISNLVVPAFGTSGQTVNYSFRLRNLGSTTASILSYRTIAWVGSPFQIFDDVAVLLLPFGTGTTIPAGADTTYTGSFTLTTNIPIGNQVLKFIADPYNQVVEDNENNNRIEVNFEVRQAIIGNFPDLTLANLTIPTPSVQQGNVLDWKVDIKNIGTGNAPANFNVRAYFSTDNILSANDIQSGIIPTGNFAAGLSVPQVVGGSATSTAVPAGQYYLILKVDADNQVTESNENNNSIVTASTFTVTAANNCQNDLIAPVISNCPQNIVLTVTGGRAFATWTPPTATDNCTTSPTVFPSHNPPFSFSLGTTTVTYRAVDAAQNQSICSFNITVNESPTRLLPDLTVSLLNLINTTVQGGDFLNFKYTVQNIGFGNTTPNVLHYLQYYISTDNILDNNDFKVDWRSAFGEMFAQEGFFNAETYLPTPINIAAGQYYLIVKMDDNNIITEANENNNVFTSSSKFTITQTQTGSYCASKSTLPWEYWISNVKFNSINNTSDKFKDFSTLGYSDYTNLSTTVSKGQSYPLSITPGLSWIGNVPNVYCRVWIDFNNNKTFEVNELVLEKTNANPLTQSVLIPTTAVIGAVRMRVALKFGAYPTACESFDKGEVEDYTVNIQGGTTTCLPTNCPPNITVSTTTNSAVVTWTAPTLSGTSCGGLVLLASIPPSLSTISSGATFPVGTSRVRYDVFNTSDGRLVDSSCHFDITVVNNSCRTQDSLQLVSLYNATNGANWRIKWNLNTPINTWNGITLNANGCVSEIHLGGNQLSGTIPPNLNMPSLLALDLYGGTIGGTIPNFNLPNLQVIELGGNRLTGSIPNFNLPNLKTLYLYANLLTGTIPNFNLPSLTALALYSNQLTGTIPNFNAVGITFIALHNNQLTGSIPAFSLPNLIQLNLSSNSLSGCIPLSLKSLCPTSIYIDISNNPSLATQNFNAFCSANNTGACSGGSADIGLSIAATPSVYKPYQATTFKITAKNSGTIAASNINIEFKFPLNTTNGGTATPSVGSWNQWCVGGVQCFTWTIQSLGANVSATLDVPVYVLNATGGMVATTKLLSSIPVDNTVSNNTATITVNQATAPAAQIQAQATQLIPIVIQRIAPNPTDGEVIIELESLDARTVQFDFSNAVGSTIYSEKRAVIKGENRLLFDVSALPQGVYLVAPTTSRGHKVPTKFVKL